MPLVNVNDYALNYEEVGTGTPFIYLAGTRFDSAKQRVPHMREHASGFRVIQLVDQVAELGSKKLLSLRRGHFSRSPARGSYLRPGRGPCRIYTGGLNRRAGR